MRCEDADLVEGSKRIASERILASLGPVTGLRPHDEESRSQDDREANRESNRNCELILKTGGAGLENVVQVVVLLKNPEDFDGMNRPYSRIFAANQPTRAVTKLGVDVPNILVSIMMTAMV